MWLAWFRWLFVDPRLVWLSTLAVTLAGVVLWLCPEFVFRSYGFALQVLGIFFAAREVFSNERLFEQPRLHDRIGGWWKRRPGAPQSVTADGCFSYVSVGAPRAIVRAAQTDADSLAEQVAKLWRNIDYISQEITGLAGQVDLNKGTFEAALKAEREAREHSERSIKDLIKEATVGSPLLAYFGVSLVLLGSAITTYSMDLHNWAK